ncbi:MAG: hypothetical protein JNK53_06955 [Phycisphaerae bacterium]|nr:hypothetical protein [Phycisphaerae bacterium]
MLRKSLIPLVLLNAALLAALAAFTFMPQASAQIRPRNNYTMVGGTVNGIVQGVVYIVNDTTNEVVAVSWWENQKKFVGLGYRSAGADAAQFGRIR